MDLLYSIHDLGFEADNQEELKQKIISYFSAEGISIQADIHDDFVHVHLDNINTNEANKKFDYITSLCNQGKFDEAISQIDAFLKDYPRYSEAYRVKAQILMDKNEYDEAIGVNIDALRCNPRNIWALLLMGNLYGKYKNDLETAKKYYDKILEYHPDNAVAINNIAAIFIEHKEYTKAITLFYKVLDSNSTYANAYYGLALCYYNMGEIKKAFDIALEGSQKSKRTAENPVTLDELHKIMISTAKQFVANYDYDNVFLGLKDEIEFDYHTNIIVKEDTSLTVSASLQYGPSHSKRYHVIKYNPQLSYVNHLKVHELMHLQMNLEAAKKGKNKIIITNNDNELAFRKKYSGWINQMIKRIGHSKALDVTQQIMEGLVLQAMNCPLDLFVEKRMYDKYPIIRPLQLLSLMHQESMNLNSIERAKKESIFPKSIVDASKVMNIVTSMHLEKLYGLQFYQKYNPSKTEYKLAKDLYEEFEAYNDYQPGEEYDLIEYFSESMNLEDFFTIRPELGVQRDMYVRQEETGFIREAVVEDNSSYGKSFDELTEKQKEQQDLFYNTHKDGENPMQTMMMAMYMQSALEYFENKSISDIKKIAYQIALEGIKGISPSNKSGYSIPSIPDKDMGGYEFLAYYYVSWAISEPDKLPALNLPFDEAYQLAKKMFDTNKHNNNSEQTN